MKKYKFMQVIPWLLLPVFIYIIILLRDGVLLELGLDFSIVHNICTISMLSRTVELVNYSSLPIRVGIISLLITMVFGPVFCSYICPFGTLQKWLYFIGEHFKITKKLPKKLHDLLVFIKYGILGLFIFLIVIDRVGLYINIDPYHAFIRLFYGGISLVGGLYLIIVIVLSLFYYRAFCNYLCPYGAGFKLVSLFKVSNVKRNADICIDCKKCDHVCPSQIPVSDKGLIRDLECFSCNECIVACPKDKALTKGSKWFNILVFIVFLIITGLFLVGVIRVPEDQVYSLTPEEITIIEETVEVDLPLKEVVEVFPVEIANEELLLEKEMFRLEVKILEAKRIADEEEAARLEVERLEAERLAKEKEEKALEAARLEAERLEKERLEAESGNYNDGVYRATVIGYRPNLVVQVELKDDIIVAIEIISHEETRSYFNYSASKMINKILNANSYDVNTVSGATYTSRGIIKGVKACLDQAQK